MVRSAEAIHTARRGAEFGFATGEIRVDFPRIIARKDEIVGRTRAALEKGFEQNPRTTLIRGHARFEGPRRLAVAGREIEGERVLVATGVAPHIPEIPGLREAGYLTNETVMDLKDLPAAMVIIGGGPEGMEFGQMFARFGTKVTVLQRRDRVLPREEEEISRELEAILREEGIDIRTRANPVRVEKAGDQIAVTAEVAGGWERFTATHLLVAAGRRPRGPEDLALRQAGIEADERGGIAIDEELHTSADRTWAIGDVIGRAQYTHFATYTASQAVENALRGGHAKVDYRRIPGAVFTDPEVASVGLTEAQAREQGYQVKVGKQYFRHVGRARAMGETKGFVKFVVDARTDELLGMHVLGHMGADLLHQGTIAMGTPGAKLDCLLDCICIHPTFSEGIKAAASNRKPVGPPTAAGDLTGE